MDDTSSIWTTLLVNGLPLVVFIVVWLLLARRVQRSSSGRSLVDLQEEMLHHVDVQSKALERIAAALEKKSAG